MTIYVYLSLFNFSQVVQVSSKLRAVLNEELERMCYEYATTYPKESFPSFS